MSAINIRLDIIREFLCEFNKYDAILKYLVENYIDASMREPPSYGMLSTFRFKDACLINYLFIGSFLKQYTLCAKTGKT